MSDGDMIGDLKRQKADANREADRHRELRDKYNEETREWAAKRDEYNQKVKDLIEQARVLRQKRDALNKEVKEEKKLREEYNKALNEAAENLRKVKSEMLPSQGPSLRKLKDKVKKLEYKMMISVYTPAKEKEIIEEIKKLNRAIEEQETILNKNQEYRQIRKAFEEAKERAEEQHRKVSKLADEAQEAHEKMLTIYDDIEKFKRLADEAQEKFLEAKAKADAEHQAHIEWIKKVRDIEKILAGEKRKRARVRQEKDSQKAEEEVSEVISRLKKGKKLSTEDLFALQKVRFDED